MSPFLQEASIECGAAQANLEGTVKLHEGACLRNNVKQVAEAAAMAHEALDRLLASRIKLAAMLRKEMRK